MNVPEVKLTQSCPNPYDVSLIAKDGKEFKAHRQVLSEASTFFDKLLNSDMKENKEGVIRLEIITTSQIADILEFIYNGNVKISTQENAEQLVAAADYLILPGLKLLASNFLEENLCIANCVPMFHFAEQYQCEELAASTRKFIHANFTSVAETEQFMSLSSCEVERWISSDDIVISAEEDVFHIIIKWVGYDTKQRSIKFDELFRHVRLTCVSRDCLISDVVTNDIVKQSKACLDAVSNALAWIDQANDRYIPRLHSRRKAVETSAIAFVVHGDYYKNFQRESAVYFYVPEKNEFFRLHEKSDFGLQAFPTADSYVFSCRSKLFFVSNNIHGAMCYDPDLNCWYPAPWSTDSNLQEFIADRKYAFLKEVLVVNSDICFILGDERAWPLKLTWLWKYDLDTNHSTIPVQMGQDVNYLALHKEYPCVVAVEKDIYFIGGYYFPRHESDAEEVSHDDNVCQFPPPPDPLLAETLSHCARFDTRENKWQDIANLLQARYNAVGVGTQEKIFIAGGSNDYYSDPLNTCEVYDIATDEWHVMASLTVSSDWYLYLILKGMVLADETLYVLYHLARHSEEELTVRCYDPLKDQWNVKIRIPFEKANTSLGNACSFRIFKGVLDNLPSWAGFFFGRERSPRTTDPENDD